MNEPLRRARLTRRTCGLTRTVRSRRGHDPRNWARYTRTGGEEEGIGDAIPATIRNALTLYRPLTTVPNIEIRLHRTVAT